MSIKFDPKVYVISVKSGYEQRQKFINEQMAKFDIKFQYMLKYDINDDDIESQLPKYLVRHPEKIYPSQSLFLKHYEILNDIVSNKVDLAIIFEDDAILAQNFVEVVNNVLIEYKSQQNLAVISLGHANNMYVPRSQIKPNKLLYPATRIRCTDSYVIGFNEAKLVVDYVEKFVAGEDRFHEAIDCFYDNVLKIVGINILWLEPSVVTQGSMNGMFSSELDHKRRERSLLMNKVHYMTNKIVKKIKSYLK